MGTAQKCPGCKAPVDYDDVPSYSEKKQRAGKFCPHCSFPLDEASAKADELEYGPGSKDAMESRAQRAKEFHEASHVEEKPAEPMNGKTEKETVKAKG